MPVIESSVDIYKANIMTCVKYAKLILCKLFPLLSEVSDFGLICSSGTLSRIIKCKGADRRRLYYNSTGRACLTAVRGRPAQLSVWNKF
jgi:hypothetical protein